MFVGESSARPPRLSNLVDQLRGFFLFPARGRVAIGVVGGGGRGRIVEFAITITVTITGEHNGRRLTGSTARVHDIVAE